MSTLVTAWSNLWDRLRSALLEGLHKIEDSSLFERLVIEYESLEPRQQKWIQASLGLIALIFLSLAVVIPYISVWNQKARLEQGRDLISTMRTFQEESSVVHKPAARPRGFQTLPVGSAEELEDSLKQFVTSIDLDPDIAALTRKENLVHLSISELSIRQALTLIFQIDGWYPAIHNKKLSLKVNAKNKELLEMEADIEFVGAAGVPSTAGNEETGASTGSDKKKSGTPPPSSATARRNAKATPPDDFDGEAPPSSEMNSGVSSDDEELDLPPPAFEDDL